MKNTTKWGLLDLVCPHTCRGCGELGAVLCERCKKYMLEERVEICPICKKIVAETTENVGKTGNCAKLAENYAKSEYCGSENDGNRHLRRLAEEYCECCDSPLEKCWVVGWREGVLARLVKDFKYKSVRAAGGVLAELVDDALPGDLREIDGGGVGEVKTGEGLSEVVVVPLPTIGRHARERGLDHTKIIAKKLAKRRGWRLEMMLARATDTVQVGAKVAARKSQAEKTYEVVKRVEAGRRYLLLDDVWTTGATMTSVARVLREAGAKEVYGVVIAVGRPDA